MLVLSRERVCFCCQSSVISPGPKVGDPVREVGDGRRAGDNPPSPGCVAPHPHEHTTGGAVPSGTLSDPEVKRKLPGIQQRHSEGRAEHPPSNICKRAGKQKARSQRNLRTIFIIPEKKTIKIRMRVHEGPLHRNLMVAETWLFEPAHPQQFCVRVLDGPFAATRSVALSAHSKKSPAY